MRIVGVVAEYDPFHRGHAHHLAQARQQTGADYVVAVMSTCFTQRGEPALLPPSDRVRMALQGGADAVFALPVLWSVRDAEHFALGSIHLLQHLGATHLAFGAETDDLPRLIVLANALESPSPAMLAAIHGRLDAGMAYPAALHGALTLLMPEYAQLLLHPNNTLAVCYLRAIQRLGATMKPVLVPRAGAYHAPQLTSGFASATAVRAAVRRGDWEGVRAAVPEASYAILRAAWQQHRVMPEDALGQALLYRLRTMPESAWSALPGLSEGIEERLRAAAWRTVSQPSLLQAAKTKRYPYARLSRLCAHALLDITQERLEETPLPPTAWLLGFRQDARPLLHHLHQSGFPLLSKAADADRSQPWFQAEVRSYDLWCLGCGLPPGMAFTQGMVRA